MSILTALLFLIIPSREFVIERPPEEPVIVEAVISHYSAIESCHYAGCPAASGVRPYVGSVACPRKYPLKTIVSIDGKQYKCEDRTARSVDGRWDIFTGWDEEAHELAIKLGIKNEVVKIIK